VEPHPHAVCSRCGRIADLSGGDWPALVSPPPAEISGFVIDIRHTVFYGLCDRCLQEIAVLDR
jgi:Fe2+ or Zn2+ uptake regulation protein